MQAERRLQEEVERVRAYLDESTEPKITKVAEQELIAKQVRCGGGPQLLHLGVCCLAVQCGGLGFWGSQMTDDVLFAVA